MNGLHAEMFNQVRFEASQIFQRKMDLTTDWKFVTRSLYKPNTFKTASLVSFPLVFSASHL